MLAIGVLLVRRHVPESPRWLFIHGREEEAEEIVTDIEDGIREDGAELEDPTRDHHHPAAAHDRHGHDRQDGLHPLPAADGAVLLLFVGQAFLYNAFFFTYGDTLTTFLDVEQTGWYLAIFAISNFLGALLLSRLFDTVGRAE